MRFWNMATDGVEAGDRRALTLVADADHDHRAGLADGTEGLPDVLVLDDADADDRRVKRDFTAQKINQKWYGDGTEIKKRAGQGTARRAVDAGRHDRAAALA
jgi:hypothetical protein